jgi:hypothetical protein
VLGQQVSDQRERCLPLILGEIVPGPEVSVAFAANGLVHFWERETAWFAEWQELAGGTVTGASLDEDDGTPRLGEEERARLAGELADAILADPHFRAASRGERWGMASRAIPKGTDPWVGRDAQRLACDRAYQIAQKRYDQLEEQLDDLTAELPATPAYQQASSAAARKKAAERFLITRADGFSPPTSLVREELHARPRSSPKRPGPRRAACSDARTRPGLEPFRNLGSGTGLPAQSASQPSRRDSGYPAVGAVQLPRSPGRRYSRCTAPRMGA